MNCIGGYFELELRTVEHYHQNALKLNTARNCLEYLLRAKEYRKIFIPYYTCEVILEPIKKLKIDYEFYHINQKLEPKNKYKLSNREAFLYTNYFGLKQEAVQDLANCYNKNLIVDNSQAFYAKPIEGIDTFYSARKFFGVPDGAYLYTNKYLEEKLEQDISYTRMLHLLKRIDIGAEAGYSDFQQNDSLLNNQPIKRMSNLTDKLLKSINYEETKLRRRKNYEILSNELQNDNQIDFGFDESSVPMLYPYFSKRNKLRKKLIKNKIFVAKFWENVLGWCNSNSFEYKFVEMLIPLPIDQRYAKNEMLKIMEVMNHDIERENSNIKSN